MRIIEINHIPKKIMFQACFKHIMPEFNQWTIMLERSLSKLFLFGILGWRLNSIQILFLYLPSFESNLK